MPENGEESYNSRRREDFFNGKAMVGLVAEYLLARMKTMLALIG